MLPGLVTRKFLLRLTFWLLSDTFSDALPAFVTRINTPHLHTLTLIFYLVPATVDWTFPNWPALDAALIALHARSPFLFVVFRVLRVDVTGLSNRGCARRVGCGDAHRATVREAPTELASFG